MSSYNSVYIDPNGYLPYLFPEYLGNDTYNRVIEKYPAVPLINKNRTCLEPSIEFPKGGSHACENRKNGTLNVLIIGNSFGHVHYEAIEQALGDKYSVLRFYIHIGCVPLGCASSSECNNYFNTALEFVKKINPDILFIIIAYEPNYKAPIVNIKNDTCLMATNNILSIMSNHTKVIFLPDEQIEFDFQISYEMSKRFNKNMDINDLKQLEKVKFFNFYM
uniref:SGNH domain-containing protein n=1 Tax=Acrobeloides nanus TaxID=290746 RepID=A0A914CGA1_9BILA